MTRAILIDLDRALGDTRALWDDWLAGASSVLDIDPATLPADRGDAAVLLDVSGGNWRTLLERYAEDRAPVYLRPAAEVSAALRRLEAAGVRIGVFTDAPAELARVAAAQLGVARRSEALEAGGDALERLRAHFVTDQVVVVSTRAQLLDAAA